ncbi:MAG: RNA polymerase sigma factor [Polyangiales bacterium]
MERQKPSLAGPFRCDHAGLVRLAARITRNAADAEDVVQLAFLRAYERAPALSEEQMRRWLYTVVRRLALDVVRKTGTRPVVLDLQQADIPVEQPTDVPLWQELTFSDLQAVIDRLPDAVRHTFTLWCSGSTYEDIARAHGAPVSTVATRVFRAKARIRSLYDEENGLTADHSPKRPRSLT